MNSDEAVWITKQTVPFKTDYQIGNSLGYPGNFAKAYRCKRRLDNKIFAVKCIDKSLFYRKISDQYREYLLSSMKTEIDITTKLSHKHIIKMEGIYEDKNCLYIVMDECKGGELFDRIVQKDKYKEREAIYIIKQILESLNYIHNELNIVHCDLKCSNILFANKSETSPIKLIDFGMSKITENTENTENIQPKKKRLVQGTPYYMAPEQIEGGAEFDSAVDLWSLGIIMYVMLFGMQPFWVNDNLYSGQREADEIYKLIKQGFDPTVKHGIGPFFPFRTPISNEAKDLIGKLLEQNPSKRLTAADALNHPWILNGNDTNADIINSISHLTITAPSS